MEIRFKAIGVVHTKTGDDDVKEKGDQEGDLEIFPEFAAGLEGIDGYSHLFVVVYFDRLRPEQIDMLGGGKAMYVRQNIFEGSRSHCDAVLRNSRCNLLEVV